VNPELVINVTCVTPVDEQQSKLSVWISWQLPTSNDDAHWHSIIEVANDRRSHLDYIAETDSDHKRLDLPANQLFDIRVCLHSLHDLSFSECKYLPCSAYSTAAGG